MSEAVVEEAVARGLDAVGPTKRSGAGWLDSVPAHWEVLRVKFVLHEVDERSDDGSEDLFSVSHLTGVTPRSEKNITMFQAASYVGHKTASEGELFVNTMWAWMGRSG